MGNEVFRKNKNLFISYIFSEFPFDDIEKMNFNLY